MAQPVVSDPDSCAQTTARRVKAQVEETDDEKPGPDVLVLDLESLEKMEIRSDYSKTRNGHPLEAEKVSRILAEKVAGEEMGIRGISIPYGTPNATAHMERLIGTLRRECLDRMLIWNERHLRMVLTEFIGWYNHGRVHQGLNGIPDPDPVLVEPKPAGG
jgi:hypothetical protein